MKHYSEDYDILGPRVTSYPHNIPTCVALIISQYASCVQTLITLVMKRFVCDGMSNVLLSKSDDHTQFAGYHGTMGHSSEDYDILGPRVSSCPHGTPTCVALIVTQSVSLLVMGRVSLRWNDSE